MRALSHVEIGVTDLERSRQFYVDLLGLAPVTEAPGDLLLDGVRLG
jgi:catechol 2,3-dioxygenase-like lactoylglutathione lyase family enzyme